MIKELGYSRKMATLLFLIGFILSVEAHANAPDCETDDDCSDYIDACCGTAEPESRGRGLSHHICWSKFSKRYLDEDGLYYSFQCMSDAPIETNEEVE